MTNEQRDERNGHFQHLVLKGIYCILLALVATNPRAKSPANNFRIDALGFGDLYGRQTEEAKTYRREVTYPPIVF